MKCFTRIAVACAIMAAGVARGQEPAQYAIQMQRPMAVGEVYDLHQKFFNETIIPIPGAGKDVVKRINTNVEISARMTVEAVDDRGDPIEFKLAISTLMGADKKKVLPQCKEVRVTRDEKGVRFSSVSELEDVGLEAAKALMGIFPRRNTSGATPDDAFPAGGKKAVDEAWMVDKAKAAAMVEWNGIRMEPETITGGAILKEVRDEKEGKRQVVQTALQGKPVAFDRLPANMGIDSGSISLATLYTVADDPGDKSMTSKMNFSIKGKVGMLVKGNIIIADFSSRTVLEISMTAVK